MNTEHLPVLPKGFLLSVGDDDVYNPERQDSAWYTGTDKWIATVSCEAEEIAIMCAGEMKILMGDEGIIRTAFDLPKHNIYTDKDLGKVDEEAWVHNSWFEIYDSIEEEYYDWVAHDISEAISMAIEAIQEKIKANVGRVARRNERGELYFGDPA